MRGVGLKNTSFPVYTFTVVVVMFPIIDNYIIITTYVAYFTLHCVNFKFVHNRMMLSNMQANV